MVATQTRHVNNRQHSIPFRQEFIEQMANEYVAFSFLLTRIFACIWLSIQEVSRIVAADQQKEAELKDKRHARELRHVEVINE